MPSQDDDWRIQNKRPPNSRRGDVLDGLHIKKTPTGYELTAPNLKNPLATTDASEPPFNFNGVPYGGERWNIHVHDLPLGENGGGHWEIGPGTDPGGDPNDGDFTAQAGGGAEEDEADAASSAYA